METIAAIPALSEQQQQQQQEASAHHDVHNTTKIHTIDDTEDYGPLKKKHKYRDERDKEHDRSGSISFSSATLDMPEDGNDAVVDSSAHREHHTPAPAPHAATADEQAGPSDLGTAAAERDQDHLPSLPEQPSSSTPVQQQQQQQDEVFQQQQAEEGGKSKDIASSPGGAGTSEKARKHNFYVPSREIAFLLDNLSSPSTLPSALTNNHTNDSSSSTQAEGGNSNMNTNTTEAQSNANALLAIGTSITGRQAAKIAAMEAKEKARLAKEKELEDIRLKRKAELDRKKAEAARKKAEKEGLPNPATISTSHPQPSNQQKRKDSSASSISGQADLQSLASQQIAGNGYPSKAGSSGKPRRGAAAPPRRSSAAKGKQESPELPMPTSGSSAAFPSPDIKIHSPSTSTAGSQFASNSTHAAIPSTSSTVNLPPMPEPQTEGMMGFIPYASEGARAAALAKAAKQQKASGGAGSPTSSSIPVPLPSGKPNGRYPQNNNAGRKGPLSTTGAGSAQLQQYNAQGSLNAAQQGKKGKSNSASAASNAKTKALQNVASNHVSSGRASPTNALEHAAAAIDAVLDAGALARAQAQAEEEEVDDRLYCICQQLYDPERLMIACDRCDNWYHADCINIDEPSITLIDLFICPICEKDSGLHTVSKARCAREDCNEPAVKLSKYCSDLCGIKVAAQRLEESNAQRMGGDDNPENLRLLWDAVSEVKKLETVVRNFDDLSDGALVVGDGSGSAINGQAGQGENALTVGGVPKSPDLEGLIAEERYRLVQLQNNLSDYVSKRQILENSLSLITARLAYLHLAIRRWEALCQHHAANAKPNASSKKSSKSKSSGSSSGVSADAPCGFDVRLVWNDKEWQEWLDSDEGRNAMIAAEDGEDNGNAADITDLAMRADQDVDEDEEEGLVCRLSRRKCDRHSAWQKLREADFQVEKAAIEKQLETLTESERRIRRRVEDIQEFLRRANDKLATRQKKASSQEMEEEADDVDMTDSVPPTPGVPVQA